MNNINIADADVFLASQDLLGRLRQEGRVLDLDTFLEEDGSFDRSDYYAGALESLRREGRTWGIPAGADVTVMYYNRDLFDQYGVPYPEAGWTWSDFLNAALALRDPDANVYGYVFRPDILDSALFVYQHGGRLFDDLQNPTRTTFDDPLTIEAMEWYADLIYQHDVAPTRNRAASLFGGGSAAIYVGIMRGHVGMWIGGLSERGGLTWRREWTMGWGIAPLPSDAQPATQAMIDGYYISSQTEHHEACWEWIRTLSEQAPTRLMPARRSLAESEAYEERVGAHVAAAGRAAMEHAIIVQSESLEGLEETFEFFVQAVSAISDDNVPPREAMERAQQQAEAITAP
jgi:multiple sugar transport system substrate-binding protein